MEAVGVRWLRGLSIGEYLAQLGAIEAAVSLLLPLLFAAMPSLVEGRTA